MGISISLVIYIKYSFTVHQSHGGKTDTTSKHTAGVLIQIVRKDVKAVGFEPTPSKRTAT